uniref:Uncharacterized protein n=1 Tax=Anguilla anguilla TaxID=7936 RepID=A0A0E9XF52_ANGAN
MFFNWAKALLLSLVLFSTALYFNEQTWTGPTF